MAEIELTDEQEKLIVHLLKPDDGLQVYYWDNGMVKVFDQLVGLGLVFQRNTSDGRVIRDLTAAGLQVYKALRPGDL
jgi:hypothetical protein